MNKILIVFGILGLLAFAYLIISEKPKNIVEENFDNEIEINIPLYYNIDNPEIIYTKDIKGNFIEERLNE